MDAVVGRAGVARGPASVGDHHVATHGRRFVIDVLRVRVGNVERDGRIGDAAIGDCLATACH